MGMMIILYINGLLMLTNFTVAIKLNVIILHIVG